MLGDVWYPEMVTDQQIAVSPLVSTGGPSAEPGSVSRPGQVAESSFFNSRLGILGMTGRRGALR